MKDDELAPQPRSGDTSTPAAADPASGVRTDADANPDAATAELAAALESWRRVDRKLWESEAHGRAGLVDARDDAYRRAVAWLMDNAGKLVVDDTVGSEMAARPDPGVEPELPTAVVERAAAQRQLAAPYRLRELAVIAAQRRGVEVAKVAHAGITRTHYRCGHLNPADDRYAASLIVTCDGCGQGYDQDASATLMMLASSGDVPLAGHGTKPGSEG